MGIVQYAERDDSGELITLAYNISGARVTHRWRGLSVYTINVTAYNYVASVSKQLKVRSLL